MRISDWSSDVCSSDLPAPAKLVIGRAIIDGHAILYDEPEVVADVQFGQTQFGTLELNAARAQIHYQGGRGNAKLLAEGYSGVPRSEEHTSELQSLMRISYAVFCLKKKKKKIYHIKTVS